MPSFLYDIGSSARVIALDQWSVGRGIRLNQCCPSPRHATNGLRPADRREWRGKTEV